MAEVTARGAIFRFGRFRLDTRQKTLAVEGELLPLTPKVVDTLIVLVERAGEVVDKDTLFETVWPGTFVVESSLTKNVSILRKALDEPGSEESVIQTVSKRGYRFAAPVHQEQGVLPVATLPRVVPASRLTAPPVLIGVIAALLVATVIASGRWRQSGPVEGVSEAERQYRIGRHFWEKTDSSQIVKALERFQKAAEIDPGSAVAQAAVADAYVGMTMLAVGPRALNLSNARQAASRAIALDPNVAVSHVSLGAVRVLQDFDATGAESDFLKALALDPNSPPAHYRYACLLVHAGRFAEARKHLRQAQASDPVSPFIGVAAARAEYYDRKYQHAAELLREVLDREPLYSPAHYFMAMTLAQLGRLGEAEEHLDQSAVHQSLRDTDRAWLRSLAGDREPARRLVEERRRVIYPKPLGPANFVMAAIAAGDKEAAMSALEGMWENRDFELLMIKVCPRFDSLRSDPRFAALVSRIWP